MLYYIYSMYISVQVSTNQSLIIRSWRSINIMKAIFLNATLLESDELTIIFLWSSSMA